MPDPSSDPHQTSQDRPEDDRAVDHSDGGPRSAFVRMWRRGRQKWDTLRTRPDVQRVLKFSQYGLFAAILVYLLHDLTKVGWGEVFANLPSAPLFYVLFTIRYFALPLSEIPAYEIVWKQPLWRHVTAFVRKRVYNFAVMGYSGEAFFTLWARRRLSLPDALVLAGVKDNNILSALVSNLATVILIMMLAANGRLSETLNSFPGAPLLFSIAFLSALTLSIAVTLFRRKVIDVPDPVILKLVAIHGGRMVLVIILHAAMYGAALPGAAFAAWFTFIALQLVLSRIPFVPNQDLVFLFAALQMSAVIGVPKEVIAGVLVAEAGLSQLFNIFLFFATAHEARQNKPSA